MSLSFPLFFQPTFTQGLVVGQLSILLLLGAVLKYLFLEPSQDDTQQATSYLQQPGDDGAFLRHRLIHAQKTAIQEDTPASETTEWLSVLMKQVVDVYRTKIRGDVEGIEGDEIARKRVEDYANSIRPKGFLDHVTVHSVDLGISAPTLSHAHVQRKQEDSPLAEIEFDIAYTDTLSVSLSTSYLFNYPMPSFARLPISLTVSLSQFKSTIILQTPPTPSSLPVLTFSVSPNFILDLTTTSLLGSRAKLANVPKLHELIQHQARRILLAHTTWKVVLPRLSNVADVEKEIKENKLLPSDLIGIL